MGLRIRSGIARLSCVACVVAVTAAGANAQDSDSLSLAPTFDTPARPDGKADAKPDEPSDLPPLALAMLPNDQSIYAPPAPPRCSLPSPPKPLPTAPLQRYSPGPPPPPARPGCSRTATPRPTP